MNIYLAGAYLLVGAGKTLPPRTLTASTCLADTAPDSWALEWTNATESELQDHAGRLGIRSEDLPDVVRWATEHFADGTLGWPNVFRDVSLARDFRDRFLQEDVHLLGIALPADLVDTFLALAAPPPHRPGCAPVGATGVYEVLGARMSLAAGGTRRGFEVLGCDGSGQFDSFRCNRLELDFHREFGATLNEFGLLDDEMVARRCTEYANRPDTHTCVGVGAWHPWLLEEYTS